MKGPKIVMEKVTSIAELLEPQLEGKTIRRIRGTLKRKIIGVEFDEQIGCVTLIVEGGKPILLWYKEKFIIDDQQPED